MNRSVIAIVTGSLAVLALAACWPQHSHAQAGGQSPTPFDTTPVTFTPAPTPSPDGKYTGSCDYTLSSNFSGTGYDHLIGEIDLHNTGNVGTVVNVRITWPQEGYAPIEAKRTVKTKPGEHLAVRFHIPVATSGNVITLLQSWQSNHNDNSGCTFKATITGTFGSVNG